MNPKRAQMQRKERIMNMNASGPTLTPLTRTSTFMDYNTLTDIQKRKFNQTTDTYLRTGTIKCLTHADYFKCMVTLRERLRLAILAEDFNEAEHLNDLIVELSDFFIENNIYKDKAELVYVIENQYQYEYNNLLDAEERWDGVISAMEKMRDDELEDLIEECEGLLNKHDNSIPSELPPKYNKLSADLLNLREQEKHLIGSRRFPEAKEYHKEYTRRTEAELTGKKQEYFVSFEARRKEIEAKNERRINGLMQDWNRRINEKVAARDKELSRLRAAVENLERKLTTAKAEYIGQDDVITEDVVHTRKALGAKPTDHVDGFHNTYLVSQENTLETKSRSRAAPKQTLAGTSRPVKRGVVEVSNKQRSTTLKKEARQLDSRRWPR